MELEDLLTADQQEAIRLAAQTDTDALRVIPVVVERSANYDRAADLLGLFGAVLALLGVWSTADFASNLPVYAAVVAVLAGYLAGCMVLGRISILRFMLSGRARMRAEVRASVQRLLRFHAAASAQDIVLIYISLFEREVAVAASEGLEAQLSQSSLEAIRKQVVQGMQKGGEAVGVSLLEAVKKAQGLPANEKAPLL